MGHNVLFWRGRMFYCTLYWTVPITAAQCLEQSFLSQTPSLKIWLQTWQRVQRRPSVSFAPCTQTQVLLRSEYSTWLHTFAGVNCTRRATPFCNSPLVYNQALKWIHGVNAGCWHNLGLDLVFTAKNPQKSLLYAGLTRLPLVLQKWMQQVFKDAWENGRDLQDTASSFIHHLWFRDELLPFPLLLLFCSAKCLVLYTAQIKAVPSLRTLRVWKCLCTFDSYQWAYF